MRAMPVPRLTATSVTPGSCLDRILDVGHAARAMQAFEAEHQFGVFDLVAERRDGLGEQRGGDRRVVGHSDAAGAEGDRHLRDAGQRRQALAHLGFASRATHAVDCERRLH